MEESSDDGDDDASASGDSDCELLEVVDLEATFQIPRLNNAQERAASAFLTSKSDTISLVQGPPGTGKTTLLTSVICRYVIDSRKLDHNKRCLMVCAPTNKAVTVLCTRFLNTFLDGESCPCNIVLIGDEDKLLENDDSRSSSNNNSHNHSHNHSHSDSSRLRESFLYTFIDTVEKDYLYIRRVLDKGIFGSFQRILGVARRLENLFKQKVPNEKEVIAGAIDIAKRIEAFVTATLRRDNINNNNNKRRTTRKYPTEIINKLDLVVGMIGAWNRETTWQEILKGADVIFCTLGSSGSSLLKRVIGEIDDLVVDEAAAATEPEIYIPFQYLPRRLLCVGDPKQLPATITSRFAQKMGLSKSLHERLMYDCNYDHIMLDTQYRMKPVLSEFPSQNFYGGKLVNGGNVVRSKYQYDTTGSVRMMDCAAPYTLYQIHGKERHLRSGSIENEAEANAVVEIVDDLRRRISTASSSRNTTNRSHPANTNTHAHTHTHTHTHNWCSANRLRIITFYQAQVALIKRLLHRRNLGNVLVATVDSSQGCEADFVVVSFVRSEGGNNHKHHSVGFVADDRRLNVALTRAKYQMICVGNIERMATLTDKAGSVKRLAINAMHRKCVHPFPPRTNIESSLKKRTMNHRDNSITTLANKRRKLEAAPLGKINPIPGRDPPRRTTKDIDAVVVRGDGTATSRVTRTSTSIGRTNASTVKAEFVKAEAETSSDTSNSDSESSVVGSSGSSSSSSSDSSSPEDSICNPGSQRLPVPEKATGCNSSVQTNRQISTTATTDIATSSKPTTLQPASATSSEVVKCDAADSTTTNANLPSRHNSNKEYIGCKEEQTIDRRHGTDSNSSGTNCEVAPPRAEPNNTAEDGPRTALVDNSPKSKHATGSSVLSKNETMAVFENFNF